MNVLIDLLIWFIINMILARLECNLRNWEWWLLIAMIVLYRWVG